MKYPANRTVIHGETGGVFAWKKTVARTRTAYLFFFLAAFFGAFFAFFLAAMVVPPEVGY
jgi:hypothetical protein